MALILFQWQRSVVLTFVCVLCHLWWQVHEMLVFVKDKSDMTAEEVERQQAELDRLTAELEAME